MGLLAVYRSERRYAEKGFRLPGVVCNELFDEVSGSLHRKPSEAFNVSPTETVLQRER